MSRRNRHDDACYCESCKHNKASACIEISCTCCLRADKIRLAHPVLTEEKVEKQESDDEEYRKVVRQLGCLILAVW